MHACRDLVHACGDLMHAFGDVLCLCGDALHALLVVCAVVISAHEHWEVVECTITHMLEFLFRGGHFYENSHTTSAPPGAIATALVSIKPTDGQHVCHPPSFVVRL